LVLLFELILVEEIVDLLLVEVLINADTFNFISLNVNDILTFRG